METAPEGRGPPLSPGMSGSPGTIFSKQERVPDCPVASDSASSSEIPAEYHQKCPAEAPEPAHDTATPDRPGSDVRQNGKNVESIEPALVEADQKTVVHWEVPPEHQQNAVDDRRLLPTRFGSHKELGGILCLVSEGPADLLSECSCAPPTSEGIRMNSGRSEQTAAENQDQLRNVPLGGSVPHPPQATPLPVIGRKRSDKGRRFMGLPRIVKHKPSSIAFSDYNHSDYTRASRKPVSSNTSSDGGGSSQEDEDEDNDDDDDDDDERDGDDDDDDQDVFLDVGAGPRCRGAGRGRHWRPWKPSLEVPSGAGRRSSGNQVGHLL
ncbi:hypothetical protein NHX12_008205 [Muraenolepis orangiensis]|uniref:Uncharacterized protein n=1 Tax=Muraenolepis orangiensis TaxID=630683 RepID=A0A9Q0DMF6_9TELE|nr:hypothetical protein NHX12_008205 [Muraenolepis orangiensis]